MRPVSRILFPQSGCPPAGGDHSSGTQPCGCVSSDLPGSIGRAALERSPIWSCTGWGLHSFPGRPENWCALTAPFHPYPACAGRYTFCCTFLRVAATPRYGAPCPVVFGLSSSLKKRPAIAWAAPAAPVWNPLLLYTIKHKSSDSNEGKTGSRFPGEAHCTSGGECSGGIPCTRHR